MRRSARPQDKNSQPKVPAVDFFLRYSPPNAVKSVNMDAQEPNQFQRDLKPHEERALRRVHNRLSGWAAKQKIRRELQSANSPAVKAELDGKLEELLARKGAPISKLDLSEMLRWLGRPSSKRYIREMVNLV